MSVAGRSVEAGEFIRMYKKSITPDNDPGFESYLGQFIEFKLKVADALSEGYDTTIAFKNELNGYRNQLAQNYLTDPTIKETLIRKAYERLLTEVAASHILINCPPDAPPADTLKSFMKALSLREMILAGEPFEKMARENSDDRSASANGGYLGFFTAFQMITPFEEAAYNLEPGEISMPVRTTYGYHLIKVAEKRPSKGKVKVAHIMKAAPPSADETTVKKAEEEINDIYQQIKDGKSFRDLALSLSDDKKSAPSGGELSWFGTGEILTEFAEAALSLSDTGIYTKPVRTLYGFHIIKLLDKRATASPEESRNLIESRLDQSYVNNLSKRSVTERLKKEYRFTINKKTYNWFVNNTDTLIVKGQSAYYRDKIPAGVLYTFSDQKLTASGFAETLGQHKYNVNTTDPKQFIDKHIELISSDQILGYEESILESKYPDFRYLVGEFHDGILLFAISYEKVWNRVQSDSTGLKNYYTTHVDKTDPPSFEEVEGEMTAGYQEWLMEEWIRQLKNKYPVKIENKILDEVRRKLANE